ncbi:hypothetical protein D3C86_1570930 [compost metagenome]
MPVGVAKTNQFAGQQLPHGPDVAQVRAKWAKGVVQPVVQCRLGRHAGDGVSVVDVAEVRHLLQMFQCFAGEGAGHAVGIEYGNVVFHLCGVD